MAIDDKQVKVLAYTMNGGRRFLSDHGLPPAGATVTMAVTELANPGEWYQVERPADLENRNIFVVSKLTANLPQLYMRLTDGGSGRPAVDAEEDYADTDKATTFVVDAKYRSYSIMLSEFYMNEGTDLWLMTPLSTTGVGGVLELSMWVDKLANSLGDSF